MALLRQLFTDILFVSSGVSVSSFLATAYCTVYCFDWYLSKFYSVSLCVTENIALIDWLITLWLLCVTVVHSISEPSISAQDEHVVWPAHWKATSPQQFQDRRCRTGCWWHSGTTSYSCHGTVPVITLRYDVIQLSQYCTCDCTQVRRHTAVTVMYLWWHSGMTSYSCHCTVPVMALRYDVIQLSLYFTCDCTQVRRHTAVMVLYLWLHSGTTSYSCHGTVPVIALRYDVIQLSRYSTWDIWCQLFWLCLLFSFLLHTFT